MKEILKVRNAIRNFCRKYDEIVTPVLRFVWTYLVLISIKDMFGYNELVNRSDITLLLAVLTALLPDGFLFFIMGVIVAVECFTISLELGIFFLVFYLIMYCVYIRFFPQYAYATLVIPVGFMFGFVYAIPMVVGLLAGIGGAVPAAFGVMIYYFSKYAEDVEFMVSTADDESELEIIKTVFTDMKSDKEMIAIIIAFIIIIAVVGIVSRINFKYSIYVAILLGTVTSLVAPIMIAGKMSTDLDTADVIFGAVIGLLVAIIVRFCMGILDYDHVQRVQYEDDDYYYYVKAVPKVDVEKKEVPKKSSRSKTSSTAAGKSSSNRSTSDKSSSGKTSSDKSTSGKSTSDKKSSEKSKSTSDKRDTSGAKEDI